MRSKRFVDSAPGFSSHRTFSLLPKGVTKKLVTVGMALVAVVSSIGVAKAQTLALNPAVTDLYSKGFVNFASTQVGQSVTVNVQLKVTGGAVTINSIATPAPANLANGNPSRIKEFTVGTITGCTVGASNATNTICTVPITFTPAYVGYQTSPLIASGTSGGTTTIYRFGLNGTGVGPQAVLMPGLLSTVAGNGTIQANALSYSGDGGQATAAQVLSHGFTFDALGNLYEAENNALVIREVSAAGVISTVAGATTTANGVKTSTACAAPANACGDNAQALTANFAKNLPDVALDSAGNIYIADLGDNRIRRVDAATGIITSIAGTGTTADGGNGAAATSATLNTPEAVVVDNQDNIYILDSNASQAGVGATVRYIDHATGFISTLAGTGAVCAPGTGNACGDGGQATAATFGISASFYVDPTTGNMWIADRDANRIRFINRASGVVSTVVGTGAANYTGNGGNALAATLNGPHGIWVDPAGDLYISDRNNDVIRFVSAATNIITTLAGGGGACTPGGNGTCGDGGPANGPNANINPEDLRLDVNGDLFVADENAGGTANNAIRKITQNPTTLTFPTVAVGVTSGPLTAELVNIGSAALTYTLPAATGSSNAAVTTTGPTATASKAFSQTNATTCGPVYSTTTSGSAADTLGAGAECNFVVAFTPDTAAGNYTGTLIETDNSLNAGAAGNTVYTTPATQVVNLVGAATQATATVGVTTTPNPSTYGQNVVITATLTGAGVSPTGTVTFTYTPAGSTTPVTITGSPATISTTGGVTTATVSTTTLPVGTDTIVATYNGDANYVAGTKSSGVAQVVNQAPLSADSLAASPNPATSGNTVTIVFTVPNGPTAPSAATSVTFSYTPQGSTTPVTITTGVKGVVNGTNTTYTTTTTTLPVGVDTITGTLTGDANYAGGSLTTSETINAVAGADTVTVATNPTTVASPDVITFSIPAVTGTAVPTGSVVFTSGGVNLGTATFPAAPTTTACSAPSGACYTVSVTTSALPLTVAPATSDTVTATYTAGGTSGYASAAPTTTVVVNQVSGTTDAVTPANATTDAATADPLTFSIPVVTGAPVPAGTVVFTSGSTNLGSATWPAAPTTGTCPGGSGTCYLLADSPSPKLPQTVAPATSTPIKATFTATAASGYASSAPTNSVVVNPVGGNGDTLTVANTTITYGTADQLSFNIPVASGAPAPAGTVVFTAGGVTLGTATWPANPTAAGGFYTLSITPTTIPVGSPTTVTGTFTATGASGYGSAAPTATVTVNKVPLSNDGISANPSATNSGQTVTLTFTVPNVNATAATGTVTFTYNGTTLGTANLAGTTANGVTTFTTTTNTLPVGSDTITGTYTGDGNYAGGALTTPEAVSQNNSNDTVTVATNPTTVGAADTITFSIPVTAGAAAPTGSVAFTSGSTNLGSATWPATPTAAGGFYTLSISTTALPLTVAPSTGTPVLATYTAGGTSGYASATASTTVVVNQVSGTGDAVKVANNPTTVGVADPITFSIPVGATGVPAPTGTVTFTSGSTSLGTATWPATPATGACPTGGGTCYLLQDSPSPTNIPLTVAPATSTPILATYTAGSGSGYASSTASTTVVVNAVAPAGDTLTIANDPTTFGTADPVTFSIPVSSGAPAPTGSVVFTAGGVTLGTATWPANPTVTGGFYTLSISPTTIPVGAPTTVTGTYTATAGSGYASGAASGTVTVNKVPLSNDGISANPSATTSGQTVTLTFTVPNVNATAATGTVTFTYNGTTLGAANLAGTTANGVTTFTTTTNTLPVGSDTITGTYTGDGDYVGGALTTTEAVSQANPLDKVTVATNPTTVGASDVITFSIPVTGGAAAPTGSVAFTSGSTNLGTATWPAAPTATGGFYTLSITTTALPLTVAPSTSTPVLATYTAGGTSGYSSATVSTTVVVNQVSGAADAVTAANSKITVGSADALTFSVPVAATSTVPVPTGTVVFTSGSTNLGSATWPATPVTGTCPGGTGTCYLLVDSPSPTNIPLTVPPATSTPITATYTAGNGSGYASSAPTTQVIVNQVGGGATLSIANNPTVFGTPDPMTFTLPVSAGAPAPSGTVTFTAGGVTLGTATFPATPTTVACSASTSGCYTLTISPSNTPVGNPTTVTATFAPGAGSGYGAATPTANVTVNPVPLTSDSISGNPNPQTFGQNVVLTFTVPNAVTTPPSGTTPPAAADTVTFSYNGKTLGAGPVTGTTAAGVTTYTVTTNILPAGADTVTGTFTGDTNYAGGPLSFVENINLGNPTSTLVAGPNPTTYGTPVTLTETIQPINGVCPVGPTTFYDNGTAIGTGAISLSNGTCVATLTSSLFPVGTDSITATVPADGTYTMITTGPTALVINKANGPDTLTSNPNPSVFGTSVTITDTIPSVGGAAPTGTVTFYSFNTVIGTGTVNAAGVATLVTSTLPVGTDSLTAIYAGDGNYAQVTAGPVNQVVTQANPGGATLVPAPNPANFGTTVTIVETIPVTNNTPPVGQVTFFYTTSAGQVQIGPGTLVNGVAMITTNTLPVGTDQITATWPGDANYSKVSSGPVAEVINKANGPDTLTVNPGSSVFGSPVVITYTVPTVGGVAATGTVTFTNNGTTIGTGALNASGVATLTTSSLPVGTDPISGSYVGDGNYAAQTAGPVNEVVTQGVPQAGLAANPNPATFGTTVTITDSIAGVNGVVPTGTVVFYNNGVSIGTAPLVNGVATLPTSTLPIGSNPITAVYSGDANYGTATTGPLQVVITKAAPTDTVTANPNPTTFGTTVTLTFTVPLVNGVVPTGTVQFFNGTTLLGTGTVGPTGVTTITTSALPDGSDVVVAQYTGDNSYAPSAPTVTVVVSPATTTGVLTFNPNPGTYGSPVIITDTVVPVNGVCPTGTVTFTSGTLGLGTGTFTPVPATGTPTSCVATTTTTLLPVGNDPVTATYPGNNNFGPITTTGTVPINKIPGTGDTLTANPTNPITGTPVVLTFTIPTVPGATPPTGTVTFTVGGVTLGTGTITTTNGVSTATLTTTALPTGTDTVVATYPGDGNYGAAAPTTVVTVTPNDFKISVTPLNIAVNPGDSAVYTVLLSGLVIPFNSPVTLSATGLPPGATVTFATPTYVPGLGPTTTTMTIVTAPNQAMLRHANQGANGIYYGLLLLPLLGIGRVRRKIRALPKGITYGLAALLMLGGLGAVTGCGGGYFGPAPQTFTITVTGTATPATGTITHSTGDGSPDGASPTLTVR